MTRHLHIVKPPVYRDNTRHSQLVPPPSSLTAEQIGELEQAARHILMPADTAVRELAAALAATDLLGVIAAQRRLLAVGELARLSATRLERSTWT